MGPGEAVVTRLNGELAAHADAVVLPLLLPDTPVVTRRWPPRTRGGHPGRSALAGYPAVAGLVT
jgi:glucose-6-phosphate dehydrogenase assembly protein OpcA